MVKIHKPYYLKLITPPKKEGFIIDYIQRLQDSRLPFGSFLEFILENNRNWTIIKFQPYSPDCFIQFNGTREEALEQALEHLKEKGFSVTPFDLESMVDKIH